MNLRYGIGALGLGLPAIGLQALAYQAANTLASGKPFCVPWLNPLYVALIGSALSALMLMVALGLYAKAKGQSVLWGLLAVLSCIGILVVALLPDETKTT